MCRLFAVTSENPLSPMFAFNALDVMREGHDGSGVGLFMTDLSGDFEKLRDYPILSGTFSREGVKYLDSFMNEHQFNLVDEISIYPRRDPPPGTPKRDLYLIRVYSCPPNWNELGSEEREFHLLRIRLHLQKRGLDDGSMFVFSFWPDVIMIKEVGDPLTIAEYLSLDRKELSARIILAQGRQNTNYSINIYACHPFFIQGFSTMTNGENTAFVPIKEFLKSRDFPGYTGYYSDSEVFTHILHYTMKHLGLSLEMFKHIITPLTDEELRQHEDGNWLRMLKIACRPLIIDGPNCVIGCTPDKTLFMVQDSKKLRPGVAGGIPGIFVFSSEMCGLEAAIPHRDKEKDFQPLKYDMAIVRKDRRKLEKWSQWEKLPRQHWGQETSRGESSGIKRYVLSAAGAQRFAP
ncbi:MAG: glutamate synthase [Syntrophales bacterium]|nr:glutamate synthase [Syntrophales bacterium]